MMTNCMCCGRELSDPRSVELGIGPICAMSRKTREKDKRDGNMFGHRAQYSWGIDGNVLWLKDDGTECRSLTNDLENCLTEIAGELKGGKTLLDYRIIYRDSTSIWDAVRVTELKGVTDLVAALSMLKGIRPYWTPYCKISFYPVREVDYTAAREKILADNKYSHPAKVTYGN